MKLYDIATGPQDVGVAMVDLVRCPLESVRAGLSLQVSLSLSFIDPEENDDFSDNGEE